MSERHQPVIWLALSCASKREALSNAIKLFGMPVERPEDSAPDAEVALLVADGAHVAVADAPQALASEGMQVVVIGRDESASQVADFVLEQDASDESVLAACDAALDMRRRRFEFRHDVGKRQSAIGTIMSGCFVIRTLEEARNLSTMLALACPHPDLTAIGLQELLLNAIEHGNLEIDGAMKQQLLLSGGWRDEVNRRLADPAFKQRVVIVTFDRKRQRIEVTIEDEGKGFDYHAWLASRDDDAAQTAYHGRGIALAREIAFSDIAYLGRGNRVTAVIPLEQREPA